MDDSPGDNIDHYTDTTEDQLPNDARFRNDEAHLEPSRWWFTSSAFPMIAGTLGPVASAFSICALGRPWRQWLEPGQSIQDAPFHPDPSWLIAVNCVQLVIALLANMSLLLNMAKRVRFSIAQPITIIGWYTSAILLMALNATAAGPLLKGLPHPAHEYVWSQAFYYGIWAAVLYFIDATLMALTFWGAYTDHYSRDFDLTMSQRTLMLQTIMFLMYLLLGALVFSTIEGWNYLDGVYWADVTLFTIGFGDQVPATRLGRGLLLPFALVGIISLGLVIGSIRSLMLERGRRQMGARMEEKQRRQTVKKLIKKGDDGILDPLHEGSNATLQREDTGLPNNEFDRRKAEFELMRKIQAKALARRKWMAMGISTGTWAVLWLVGALVFLHCEKKYQSFTYYDGVYFCFVSFTTIGYGDVSPISNAGKSFFVFWSLLALPTMTVLISNAGDTVVKFIRDITIALGNVTILPGEAGFSHTSKHLLSQLTCGQIFASFREAIPKITASEFIERIDVPRGDSPPPAERSGNGGGEDTNGDARGRKRFLDVESQGESPRKQRDGSTGALSTFTTRVRRSLSRMRDPLDDLPQGSDFHFLLISEIHAVTQHLKADEPRRYTYEEWAWYLRLIGEDERRSDRHRRPRAKEKKYRESKKGGDAGDLEDDDDDDDEHRLKWSWVGNRSPLMGSQEESEWILDQLSEKLKEELSAEGRRRTKSVAAAFVGAAKRSQQSSDDGTLRPKQG